MKLFTFNWTEKHEFSEQETAIYHALVDLAPPAVAAHCMAQDARTRAEELAVLNELSQALTTRLTVDEVLAEAYKQTSRLIDTSNFDAQQQALRDLSTPIIPVMDTSQGGIIVMPLIGSIDTMRARDITRSLLAGVREHRAKVVIMDITGVPVVDSGVANYLNKTIQAARLKGAHTVVTGISDAVAETIVELGIDWRGIETLPDLQMGLRVALARLGQRIKG